MSEALAHRHDVMAALSRVFRTFGYEGATLSRICAATDLPRGSLYHYFPNGKPDMLRAVLEDTETQFERHVLDRMHAPGDPRDRIRIMTRFLNGYYDKGASGCILAVLALGEADDSSSAVVKRVFQKWIKALSAVLKDAGLPQTTGRRCDRSDSGSPDSVPGAWNHRPIPRGHRVAPLRRISGIRKHVETGGLIARSRCFPST